MLINTSPGIHDLEDTLTWLKEEDDNLREGFYCNKDHIEHSYHKNTLITFHHESTIIGFLTWHIAGNNYVMIDLTEIHPSHRGRGYGKKFLSFVEEFFKMKEFKAVKLFCSPEESEPFWCSMNYLKCPESGYSQPELTYYKPLITVQEPTDRLPEDRLELWDMESYAIKEQKPTWTWDVAPGSLPIIHPCSGEWNIRLIKGNDIVKETSVKYFDKEKDILDGDFLFYND